MIYSFYYWISVAQSQNLLNFNIPFWVWILLGILLLAVILGLILGERMAEDRSFLPNSRKNSAPVGLIPQTGGDTQSDSTDLTLLHGIDPGTQQALNSAGINTFEQLAQTSIKELNSIILPVNGRMAVVATWPDQAKLAAAGQWNELRDWQTRLKKSA